MKDVLIIGAGPSGCVAASHLANLGYNVTIAEKEKFPRFMIGESLLPISMEHFEETGLLKVLKSSGFEIKRGALFIKGEREMDISFSESFTPGWSWTWQVPRDEFDHILAKETEKKGVEIIFESQLQNLDFGEDSVTAKILFNNKVLNRQFRYVIDSSGNAGVLSKMLGIKTVKHKTGRKSIFTHVKDIRANDFPRSRRISFEILAQDLWFWIIPFSNNVTSLGFVGDKKWFDGSKDLNKLFEDMLQNSSSFKNRFEGLDFLFDVHEIEDYSSTTEKIYGHRFVMAGNTTGFIDPLFSSGVAMATTSGLKAAKLVSKELKGEYVNWESEYADYLNSASNVYGKLIQSWYDGYLPELFFYPKVKHEIKKQLTSILAGYVWDEKNPFVKKNYELVKTIAKVIELEKNSVSS